MPDRSSKRPSDPNLLAKLVVDISTGESQDAWRSKENGKNSAAVALGRLGGKKGGAARAASLSPQERQNIARNAALKRWKKDD